MGDCLVGRCNGCNAVRMGRWLGDAEDAKYRADWGERGFLVSREAEATIEPCRCEEMSAAVLRAAPDATPERVEALLRVGLAVEQGHIRAATLAEAVQAVDALRPEAKYPHAYWDGINAALEALGRLGEG